MNNKDLETFAHLVPERDPAFQLKPAWKQFDSKMEEDALNLWRKHKILPPEVDPADRLDQLCIVAYYQDQPVAISTANIMVLKSVQQKFAFVREFVVPEFREHDLARWLIVDSKSVLSHWSQQNPKQQVMGLAVVIQSNILQHSEIHQYPRWPQTGLSVSGYTTDGDQLRMVWFDHALLPKADS
ncbi:MAG: hypothetical protein EP340_08595 [Alphaproteobacteria bacterium]|nr:MAG: hypothetical protein EP340_08595 [Alphaproteobacteria bacterium]